MKLLLVTQAFPPFNTSGAVRVGQLASYLMERGHDVRVLTAAPLPYPATLAEDIPADLVIRTRSLDPFTLRNPQRRAVPGAPTAAGASLNGGWLRSAVRAMAIPEPQVGWYPHAVAAGRRLVRSWQPDVIYASALPFTAHLVAARLARDSNVPWIAEFRDHFAGNPYVSLPAWRTAVDRWLERRVLASTAACVTVSQPMADTLQARHDKPSIVVLNGFDSRRAGASEPPPPNPAAPLRIVYTGLIYPGRRDPSPLFAAIAALAAERPQIEVAFYGQDLRGVAESARQFGVSECVTTHAAIPHAEALRVQQNADVLLLLLWDDPREAGVYTGKLFEYVGASRQILAIGATGGVAADLISQRALGEAARDPQAIASALRRWIGEKRATGRVMPPPTSAKSGLSRQEQFARVSELLTQVVHGSASAHHRR